MLVKMAETGSRSAELNRSSATVCAPGHNRSCAGKGERTKTFSCANYSSASSSLIEDIISLLTMAFVKLT